MPNPPEAAELILRALLPADARECVSGDLLEEYRESRVPSAGELRADLWYWRQVGGIWLRAYWWLVAPVVLVLEAARLPLEEEQRRLEAHLDCLLRSTCA